jgi:hypothetical protein
MASQVTEEVIAPSPLLCPLCSSDPFDNTKSLCTHINTTHLQSLQVSGSVVTTKYPNLGQCPKCLHIITKTNLQRHQTTAGQCLGSARPPLLRRRSSSVGPPHAQSSISVSIDSKESASATIISSASSSSIPPPIVSDPSAASSDVRFYQTKFDRPFLFRYLPDYCFKSALEVASPYFTAFCDPSGDSGDISALVDGLLSVPKRFFQKRKQIQKYLDEIARSAPPDSLNDRFPVRDIPVSSGSDNVSLNVRRAENLASRGYDSRAAQALLDVSPPVNCEEKAVQEELCSLHPPLSNPIPKLPPQFADFQISHVDPDSIRNIVKKHCNGSASGPSGWTFELLLPFVSDERCLAGLSVLIKHIINGVAPRVLLASHLIGRHKRDSVRLRPIAMCEVFLKIAEIYVLDLLDFQDAFPKNGIQLGVKMRCGVEAIVHSVQSSLDAGDSLLSLDFKNAFNSISRATIADELHRHPKFEQFMKLFHFMYDEPAPLLMFSRGKVVRVVLSCEGVRAGSCSGGFCFALGVLGLYARSLSSVTSSSSTTTTTSSSSTTTSSSTSASVVPAPVLSAPAQSTTTSSTSARIVDIDDDDDLFAHQNPYPASTSSTSSSSPSTSSSVSSSSSTSSSSSSTSSSSSLPIPSADQLDVHVPHGLADMDDFVIVGPPRILLSLFDFIRSQSANLNLSLNADKCRLLIPPTRPDVSELHAESARREIQFFAGTQDKAFEILGIPVGYDQLTLSHQLEEIVARYDRYFTALRSVRNHLGLHILRMCYAPLINHFCRALNPAVTAAACRRFDSFVDQYLLHVLNDSGPRPPVEMFFPLKQGGIGIRHMSEVAPLAYLSSLIQCYQSGQFDIVRVIDAQYGHSVITALDKVGTMLSANGYSFKSCAGDIRPVRSDHWEDFIEVFRSDPDRIQVTQHDLTVQLDKICYSKLTPEVQARLYLSAPDRGFLTCKTESRDFQLTNSEISTHLRIRYGLPPLSVEASDPATALCECGEVENYFDHVSSCRHYRGGVSQRHNEVVDAIAHFARLNGIRTKVEPIHDNGGFGRSHPDIMLTTDRGTLLIDVAIIHSLAPSYRDHSFDDIARNRVPRCLEDHCKDKHRVYPDAWCTRFASHSFLRAFVIDAHGYLSAEASQAMDQILAAAHNISGIQTGVLRRLLRAHISCALARGDAKLLSPINRYHL